MVCFNCYCWWSAEAADDDDDGDDGDDDDDFDDEDAAGDNLLVRLWGRLAATTAASPATPAGLSLGLYWASDCFESLRNTLLSFCPMQKKTPSPEKYFFLTTVTKMVIKSSEEIKWWRRWCSGETVREEGFLHAGLSSRGREKQENVRWTLSSTSTEWMQSI